MKIIYSIGTKFAGGGIGNIAYQDVRAIAGQGMLHRLLCGAAAPNDIPATRIRTLGLPDKILRKLASYDRSGWVWYIQGVFFDIWATRYLEQADLFVVWNGHGLRCLRKAHSMGIRTVVVRASTHPRTQQAILSSEYARRGMPRQLHRQQIIRTGAELEQADYSLIPSEYVRNSCIAEGMAASRLIMIPFGVDIKRFQPGDSSPGRPFRLLFVGQIGVRKGIFYLLEAWQELGWRNAELWLAGRVEPGMHAYLRRYADLPGVSYRGHSSDAVTLYQAADLFVFPSLEEGSALVTYEALACGLPVITTANAGSVIRDGQEGLLVPTCDAHTLAHALETLRSDSPRRSAMRRAARQRATEFTWERHGQLLAAALADLNPGAGR